jgi:hypothetical protein
VAGMGDAAFVHQVEISPCTVIMGNIGPKESKCKEYKDQSHQCDLDASLRTEVNTLRFTVIKLEDDMFDLKLL